MTIYIGSDINVLSDSVSMGVVSAVIKSVKLNIGKTEGPNRE